MTTAPATLSYMPRQKPAPIRPLLYGTTSLLIVQAINFLIAEYDVQAHGIYRIGMPGDWFTTSWRMETCGGDASLLMFAFVFINIIYAFATNLPAGNSRATFLFPPLLPRFASLLPVLIQLTMIIPFGATFVM